MQLPGEPVVAVWVVEGTANRNQKIQSNLKNLNFDSIPVFTDKNVEYYDYSGNNSIPRHKITISRHTQRELRRRVSDLYYRSFVLTVNNEPVYGGVFIPDVKGGFPPTNEYIGPIIRLPGEEDGSERIDSLFIDYESDGEIWDIRNDPRADTIVLNTFRALKKLRNK